MKIIKFSDLLEKINEGDLLGFLKNYDTKELTSFFNYLTLWRQVNKRDLRKLLLLSILGSHKETEFIKLLYKIKGNSFIDEIKGEIKKYGIRK